MSGPITTNERAVMGGNAPPVSTGLQSILDRYAELQATCSAWLTKCPKIETQEQADDCAGFSKQLTALEKEAEAARIAEQKPHQDKVVAIRESYRPTIDGLGRMKALLQPKQTAWLQAERIRIEQQQREAREAAELADRRAREAAEEAARLAARAEAGELLDSKQNVMATINQAAEAEREAADRRREAEEAERLKAKSGGQHMVGGVKRSTSLRSHTEPVISDLKKAAAYFAKQANADLAEAVLKAARAEMRATKSTPAIPGISYVTTEKAV
jgi:hypothetical protein